MYECAKYGYCFFLRKIQAFHQTCTPQLSLITNKENVNAKISCWNSHTGGTRNPGPRNWHEPDPGTRFEGSFKTLY